MIKQAIFCDFCKQHIKESFDCIVIFSSEFDGLKKRKFDSTGKNDVCICSSCQPLLKKVLS